MANHNIRRKAVRSALLWAGVYVAAMLARTCLFSGPFRIPISPGALTLLSTAISLVTRLTVLFMAGFTVGRRDAVHAVSYAALAGAIAAVLILLFDAVSLLVVGGGAIIGLLSQSPLISLAYVLVAFGLHVGVAAVGGLAGRRFRSR